MINSNLLFLLILVFACVAKAAHADHITTSPQIQIDHIPSPKQSPLGIDIPIAFAKRSSSYKFEGLLWMQYRQAWQDQKDPRNNQEIDLYELYAKRETDAFSYSIGRQVVKLGPAQISNPADPFRAAVANRSGPFDPQKGVDHASLQYFYNDNISLRFLVPRHRSRKTLQPLGNANIVSGTFEHNLNAGQNFLGLSSQTSLFESSLIYFEANTYRATSQDPWRQDALFGAQYDIAVLQSYIGLEYLRSSTGYRRDATEDYLRSLQSAEPSQRQERNSIYPYEPAIDSKDIAWSSSSFLNRDVLYIFMRPFADYTGFRPFFQSLIALNDHSSRSTAGVMHRMPREAFYQETFLFADYLSGSSYSEYGWVAKQQGAISLQLGIRLSDLALY